MSFARARGLRGMTIIASPTTRTRPVGHAYVMPVVREVAPPKIAHSATEW